MLPLHHVDRGVGVAQVDCLVIVRIKDSVNLFNLSNLQIKRIAISKNVIFSSSSKPCILNMLLFKTMQISIPHTQCDILFKL